MYVMKSVPGAVATRSLPLPVLTSLLKQQNQVALSRIREEPIRRVSTLFRRRRIRCLQARRKAPVERGRLGTYIAGCLSGCPTAAGEKNRACIRGEIFKCLKRIEGGRNEQVSTRGDCGRRIRRTRSRRAFGSRSGSRDSNRSTQLSHLPAAPLSGSHFSAERRRRRGARPEYFPKSGECGLPSGNRYGRQCAGPKDPTEGLLI